MNSGDIQAKVTLDRMTEKFKKEPLLGCSLVSHRDLGFCSGCIDPDVPLGEPIEIELISWRLLAMAQRGIPPQPSEVRS